ncbi:alpha-L-fucosidase [Paenibacillus sp. 598K]|uniref:alpha-L-fucosidase n=1 Tax=Paenibacillus sp. 598K TaxID=1117987 RepID=UPI000FF9C88D|nr:alpha-L-fucosidase [Paenibacillus sp. 598K]GBF73758.1 alpha-L-fucosidase [Paenibacillus sp. 598K]
MTTKNEREAWRSIDERPLPAWYDDAKFGIFIHWGLYSVPSWGPKRDTVNTSGEAYAEWYGSAVRQPGSQYEAFHKRVYGDGTRYEDFVAGFGAELYDPEAWAALFREAGARYVVLTAKHHDAYCLWPSPHRWNWNSVDVGPGRDLYGELDRAVRAEGLRMGAYYSLLEWYNPLYLADPAAYARTQMVPQMRQLVEAYAPSVLFTDGEWEHHSDVWDSRAFLEWLYTASPVSEEIVVNDRWGKETRGRHGGYYTTEYGEVGYGPDGVALPIKLDRKWEENRGIGTSFGYNRNETLRDYLGERELIHLLVDTVSRGGNLLLNVGPTADGRIPVIMEERLRQLGDWLRVNGEAIYGTRSWRTHGEGETVRYTTSGSGDTLYVHCLRWPGRELTLHAEGLPDAAEAQLLGWGGLPPVYRTDGARRIIALPELDGSGDDLPCRHVPVIALRYDR